jgi:glycine cleavage system H protein
MNVPNDRKYSETHEWFLLDAGVVTIGITQYAADELTDITYVELPDVGKTVGIGDAICEVESVKATSDVYSAIAGEIIEVNTSLVDNPELINTDAFEEGWLVKIMVDSASPLKKLMDSREYVASIHNTI